MIRKFYDFEGLSGGAGGYVSAAKKYIGCKIITAELMTEGEWMKSNGANIDMKRYPISNGYKVTYPDGYVSWSPKEVFESAYREITPSEIELINIK